MEKALAVLGAWAAGLGLPLSSAQQGSISLYAAAAKDYNARTNITADDDLESLILRHVADGVAAAALLKPRLGAPEPRVLDLGSGGGFVGIGLKIAWPEAVVTLMEPLKRKFEFLNLASARLGLKGLRVVRAGAGTGTPPPPRERDFDAVVARALAPLPEALKLGLPLTAPRGLFGAFQSAAPDAAEPGLAKAMAGLGARLAEAVPYRLPAESKDRCLALFSRLEIQGSGGTLSPWM